MIPKEFRLKHKRDFGTIFDQGRFVPGRLAYIKLWKIDPKAFPRRSYQTHDLKFAFVVSTKLAKRAVERNRLKRQMRESVRLLMKTKGDHFVTGYLVAILAKPEIRSATFQEINEDIHRLLLRSGILAKAI